MVLADDNADMRDYAGRLLRDAGFDVDAAPDGESAFEIVRHVRPDLVLSDVMMPKLDGFGLLSRMRADPELSHIPVLLLSARAGEEAKVEGLGSGADDYLIKPFSARELIARVEGNLRLARARREKTQALVEEAKALEALNKIGNAIAAEVDLARVVQVVTDAATELSGAAFGSFFYNVLDERGESYTLYTLSGVPREAFSKFPQPRNTEVFAPTFRGEGMVRSPDITKIPASGKMSPIVACLLVTCPSEATSRRRSNRKAEKCWPSVREHSAELLRELGYNVIEAEDAQDALRKLERIALIDLLFTDIGLPGMNGRQLVEEALRRRPQLKVLYTTGYARNAIVHHGRLDPGVQLITKPFTYANLAARVRDVLDT